MNRDDDPEGTAMWAENQRLRALLAKHEWHPHDESRDYCIECGGTKPEPEDFMPLGHVKGCALEAALRHGKDKT
jgi:hypothetical protein